MESQEIKRLISELEDVESSISIETKQAFIRHGGEKEVLETFAHILEFGDQSVRVKVIEILSDILSEQAFELLFFALHDPSHRVRTHVNQNLEQGKDIHERADDAYRKSLEELSRMIHRSDNPEKIAAIVEERNRVYDRKLYFLPIIETRLKNDNDMDLSVRSALLSILSYHDAISGIDNLMDAMVYGNPDLKMYAIEKLGLILNDETRRKIRFAMLERLQVENHSDVRNAFKKALSPEPSSEEPRIYFSSNWFEDAVLFFRRIGFFQEYTNLADHELVEQMKEVCHYISGQELSSTTGLLLILAEDEKRVWFADAECYSDQKYIDLLKEWGDISCGTFSPKDIVETRNELDGKILITFSHQNKQWEIYAEDCGDWIDIGLLEQINEIIIDSEFQFFNIPPDSQEVCIVCLNLSQKRQLEKYLRLQFEVFGRLIHHPKL